MTRAIIFDLDNCLAASNEPGGELFARPFAAIRKENHGTLPDETLDAALSECWRSALDHVAKKHGFSDAMLAAGWKAFENLEVTTPMRGYDDLAVLSGLPARLFLVTSGFRRLQESKVRALGIAGLFAAVQIDAIDEPDRKGKQGLFEEIMKEWHLAPEEVLVVGDNAESEIAAGNRLGIRTVQILRPGVPRSDNATFYISSLNELVPLLGRSG